MINQIARARKAWRILAARARAKRAPMTYGDLCAPLGLHPKAAGWFLGVIQDHCRKNGLPPLQALAVAKRTGVPGKGYTGSSRSVVQHRRAVARVHRYGKR